MRSIKATDNQILRAYRKTGSVWRAAEVLGMCGQSVHERLVKLGATLKFPKWSTDEDARLVREYSDHANAGTLTVLAMSMGRTKPFIARQAGRLGLTNASRKRAYSCVWRGISRDEARVHFDKFISTDTTVREYCEIHGYDDLGFTTAMKTHFESEWNDWMGRECKGDSSYHIGRKVEYAIKRKLLSAGYHAMLSPGSKGPVDIVGVKHNELLFFQCKKSMACPVGEWNALYDLSRSVGAMPLLAGLPNGKEVVCMELTGRKTGRKTRQPMMAYEIV